MAVKPLFTVGNPVGDLDVLDTELDSFKGGEIVALTSVAVSADQAAADVAADGYVTATTRLVVSKAAVSASTTWFALVDDGKAGYTNPMGTVIGGTCGKVKGAALGWHSAFGSGKLSLWRKGAGTFQVTFDAVDASLTSGMVPGQTVYAETGTGVLTATASGNLAVGTFRCYAGTGSKVNTYSDAKIDRIEIEI
jgi:hypothetical protein